MGDVHMGREGFITKRNVILILICIALVICLVIYRINNGDKDANPDKNVVTAGQVARAVALIYHSTDECREMEDYFNGTSDEWYVPYMNAMYKDTLYLTKDIKPTENSALAAFTYGDLDRLLTNIGVADKELWSYVKNNKVSNPIVTKEWNEIYGKLAALLDTEGKITEKNICIVGTVANVPTMDTWHTVTTGGEYLFTGLSIDYYIDREVSVLVKDNELLCIRGQVSKDVTYHNVWIISVENGRIKAYIEGAVREFETGDRDMVYSGVAADLILENKKVEDLKVKSKSISGKVLTSGNSEIELEGKGKYALDENVRVYKTYGSMEMKKISDVLVGYDIQKFILNDEDKISAIAIDRDVNAKNIRVLLRNTGNTEMYHDRVVITSDTPFVIEYGSESKLADGGTVVELDVNSTYLSSGRMKISSQNVNGKITVSSIERGYGTPSYRGTLDVSAVNGRLIIVNELPIEEYLYAVVPSEMPYTYSTEALKSQAVCARSYAYRQLLNNSLSSLGAHVDDSTSFQVYNNSEEKQTTTNAVDSTYGEIMMCGEDIVNAWFFSTSCGSSADATVWGGSGVPYIKGHILSGDGADIDLTDESNFDTFIRSNFDTYDSSYSWYRWNLSMTLNDMTQTVNEVLGSLYSSGPDKVLTMGEDGEFHSQPISSAGQVKRIAIGSRGTGGVLDYVVIYGTEATVKVVTESYIRKLFHPVSSEIIKNDGSVNSTMGMLPSAYVVFDAVISEGVISGYNIIGGGYGHGVGLSQNGANTMGNNGVEYSDILKFFYSNIEITKIY